MNLEDAEHEMRLRQLAITMTEMVGNWLSHEISAMQALTKFVTAVVGLDVKAGETPQEHGRETVLFSISSGFSRVRMNLDQSIFIENGPFSIDQYESANGVIREAEAHLISEAIKMFDALMEGYVDE